MDEHQQYEDLCEAKRLLACHWNDIGCNRVQGMVIRAQLYLDRQAGEIANRVLSADEEQQIA